MTKLNLLFDIKYSSNPCLIRLLPNSSHSDSKRSPTKHAQSLFDASAMLRVYICLTSLAHYSIGLICWVRSSSEEATVNGPWALGASPSGTIAEQIIPCLRHLCLLCITHEHCKKRNIGCECIVIVLSYCVVLILLYHCIVQLYWITVMDFCSTEDIAQSKLLQVCNFIFSETAYENEHQGTLTYHLIFHLTRN